MIKSVSFLTTVLFGCMVATSSRAEVLVVASKNSQSHTEKEIRDLYLGHTKSRSIELLDQAEGQEPRTEFNEKFLNKSEREIHQQRSIQVFSGSRVPRVLHNDDDVIDYLKSNPESVGYVDGATHKPVTLEAAGLRILFSVK